MSEITMQNLFGTEIEKLLNNPEYAITSPTINEIKSNFPTIYPYFKGNSKNINASGDGIVDFIYYNKTTNLLIIVEIKEQTKDHRQAISDIKHYVEPFSYDKTSLKVIAIAFSGNIQHKDSHKIDTFTVRNNKIIDLQIIELLTEKSYINIFKTQKTREYQVLLSAVAKKINNDLLREINSEKRPVLLACLIIVFYDNKDIPKGRIHRDFENQVQLKNIKVDDDYDKIEYDNMNLIADIPNDIESILMQSRIPQDKIRIILTTIKEILSDNNIQTGNILKNLCIEVYKIMFILKDEVEFDIMAGFYSEFLRYATGNGKDLGIVLTPFHITELMTELADCYRTIQEKDTIYDPCTGTGGFLTAFMNFQIEKFAQMNLEKQEKIKANNLNGIEYNKEMYILAVANMLVRGDGKSSIHHGSCFNYEAEDEYAYGILNPPYSQKKDSEIKFIYHTLNRVKEGGIVCAIVPRSTMFKDIKDEEGNNYKELILNNNTLLCSINMPDDLFYPVGVNTTIAIFKAGIPHNKKDYVYFCHLYSDGFSSIKGVRRDLGLKWNEIKKSLLDNIRRSKEINKKSIIVNEISYKDEWIPEAFLPTDYDDIIENGNEFFDDTIDEYVTYLFRKNEGILEKEIEISNMNDKLIKEELSKKIPKGLKLFRLMQNNKATGCNILDFKQSPTVLELNSKEWKPFFIIKDLRTRSLKIKETINENGIFSLIIHDKLDVKDGIDGDFPLIARGSDNNNITKFISYIPKQDISKTMTINLNGAIGKCFYHEYNYITTQNVHVLKNKNLNKFTFLFIKTLIEKSFDKNYQSFGRELIQKKLSKEQVMLPINDKGNPDWKYMEDYIKNRAKKIKF
ncbi:N-6 DNA methylase [Sulfurimonas sp.]